MDSIDMVELGRIADDSDDGDRGGRTKRLLVILLLLLLLFFGVVLAFLTMYGDLFRPREAAPGITHLFSLFGFDRPLNVTTDKEGRVIVSDTGNARIVTFDSTGRYLNTIRGAKDIDRLYGVTGTYYDDKDGKLYVSEFRRRTITVYNRNGKRLARWPKAPGAPAYGSLGFAPFGITMHKERLYVTSNNGIFVFSKKGKLLKQWTDRGSDIGQFDYPIALAIDKDGTMYIADQLNRRVVAMTQRGVVKWTLGRADVKGKASSFFGLPRGIALDDKGRIFVADSFHHELVVLSKEGELLGVVANRGVEDAHLNFPEGIAFRPDGALYIADRENNRVQAWRIRAIRKATPRLLKRHKKYFYQTKG